MAKIADEIMVALAKGLGNETRGVALPAGAYTVGHEVALRIIGVVTKDADSTMQPKADIPLEVALAHILDRLGVGPVSQPKVLEEAFAASAASVDYGGGARQPLPDELAGRVAQIKDAITLAQSVAPLPPVKEKSGGLRANVEVEVVACRQAKPPAKKRPAKKRADSRRGSGLRS